MTRTPRPLIAVAVAAVLLVLPACDEVGQVVEEAQTQVEEAAETAEFCASALRLADAVDDRDVDGAVAAGEDFVDKAPDEIRPDAQRVLEAARRAQDGDVSALDDEEVVAAAERIRSFSVAACNPTADDA